jgi:hypothetical protein
MESRIEGERKEENGEEKEENRGFCALKFRGSV